MNKLKKIFILLLSVIILCSCQKDNTKYELIEITGEELINNISSKKEQRFIFALYNTNKKNADSFYQTLESLVNNINSNIYYVNYNHLDDMSALNLFTYDFGDFTENSYYFYDKGDIKISSDYTDFATAFKELKNISKTTSLKLIDKSTKEEYIKEASKLYDDGNIAKAYNELNKAWNLKEAKEEYNKNPLYNLINSWEAYEFLDDDYKEVNYYNFLFMTSTNYYYEIIIKDKYQNFNKPNDLNEYTKKFYQIKENTILISNYENGNYKEKYQIKSINDERLSIVDLDTNKKINFVKRS